MTWHIIQGDNLPALRSLADDSIDACVCDPPYELAFMGRRWDASGVAFNVERWREVLRVLKPGGYLLAFGGTRTYHRMACAIEDAGFEIRDSIHWVYGSGFPKSLDVSKAIDAHLGAEREVVGEWRPTGNARPLPNGKHCCAEAGQGPHPERAALGTMLPITAPATPQAQQWNGWGTALKPSHEPIIVARKPLAGTVAANVLAHGTGGINVDACRVDSGDPWTHPERAPNSVYGASNLVPSESHPAGRWPPNLLLAHHPDCGDECHPSCPVSEMDRQSGDRVSGSRAAGVRAGIGYAGGNGDGGPAIEGSSGGASRFFPVFRYCAKADRVEREAGCEALPARTRGEITGREDDADGCDNPRSGKRAAGAIRNTHPTVKPVELMQWLVRLVTPPGGIVLDPYCGSGTTGIACVSQGFSFLGLELEPAHVAIAEARIRFWERFPGGPAASKETIDAERAGQVPLFGGS